MLIKLVSQGGGDQTTNLEVWINEKNVGLLMLEDKDVPKLAYKLLGEYVISQKV